MEALIECRKERFLTHPLFETFLKLKWHKTWRVYLLIMATYLVYVMSVVGYALAHFGRGFTSAGPWDPNEVNGWWYFLATTSTLWIAVEVIFKILYHRIFHDSAALITFQGFKCLFWISHCMSDKRKHMREIKNLSTHIFLNMFFAKSKDIAIPVLSMVMLLLSVDAETRKYVSAITVVLSCFKFILMLSR